MLRLTEIAAKEGLPFNFTTSDGRSYICKSLFSADNVAACSDIGDNFYLFSSDKPIYTQPTPTLTIVTYLVQCIRESREISPIIRLSFISEDIAKAYCSAYDYKIIKRLPDEEIDV